jgi:hypothetical protein
MRSPEKICLYMASAGNLSLSVLFSAICRFQSYFQVYRRAPAYPLLCDTSSFSVAHSHRNLLKAHSGSHVRDGIEGLTMEMMLIMMAHMTITPKTVLSEMALSIVRIFVIQDSSMSATSSIGISSSSSSKSGSGDHSSRTSCP